MHTEKYVLKNWHFLFILLTGTCIRFLYGYMTKGWLSSPDQLAWGLSIDEMLYRKTWCYNQLIHYPHEGGSLVLALLSIPFRPLQFIMPSLSWTALLMDLFSRYIQIKITQKIFGNLTALCFGLWTILTVPLLLPWSTINFGLHSVSAFFPFLSLYVFFTYRENKYLPVFCGLLAGLAVSFSYDSIDLVFSTLLILFVQQQGVKNKIISLLKFVLVFGLTILPHILVREFADSGFELVNTPAFSIREIPLLWFFLQFDVKNLLNVWYQVLPGSLLLSFITQLTPEMLKNIILFFIFSGILFFCGAHSTNKFIRFQSLTIFGVAICLYTLSPFYNPQYRSSDYVAYRHICFFAPLLIVIMINGFLESGSLKYIFISGWISLCSLASIQFINTSVKKPANQTYKAAGWVIARKFGHNPRQLIRIHAIAEKPIQNELLAGYGWGLTSVILENRNEKDTAEIIKLAELINQFPLKEKPLLRDGVHYAFSQSVIPILNKNLEKQLDSILNE